MPSLTHAHTQWGLHNLLLCSLAAILAYFGARSQQRRANNSCVYVHESMQAHVVFLKGTVHPPKNTFYSAGFSKKSARSLSSCQPHLHFKRCLPKNRTAPSSSSAALAPSIASALSSSRCSETPRSAHHIQFYDSLHLGNIFHHKLKQKLPASSGHQTGDIFHQLIFGFQ